MPRPRPEPTTALAQAIQLRRGDATGREIAPTVGVSYAGIHRLERGARPGVETALTIARWLGWTMEEVLAAAKRPPLSDAELAALSTEAPLAPVVQTG